MLQDAGLSGGEPPEKERRRLKESFENYRRWARGRWAARAGRRPQAPRSPAALSRRKRALRKMQPGPRQGEVDWENTTGSDNTDTEGS